MERPHKAAIAMVGQLFDHLTSNLERKAVLVPAIEICAVSRTFIRGADISVPDRRIVINQSTGPVDFLSSEFDWFVICWRTDGLNHSKVAPQRNRQSGQIRIIVGAEKPPRQVV